MDFILFIIFSTLEYLSSLVLMLTLFRFSVKDHFAKFAVSSVILAFISNTLIEQGLESISSVLQLLLFLFLVTLILRVHIYHSLIMVITTFFIFAFVQITLIMIFNYFGIMDGSPKPYHFSGYLAQGSASFYMFLFAIIISLRHGGFSFVDHNPGRGSRKFLFNKSNRTFFIVMVLTFIFFIVANVIYAKSPNPPFLWIAAALLVCLITLVYLSIRRDR